MTVESLQKNELQNDELYDEIYCVTKNATLSYLKAWKLLHIFVTQYKT